MEDNKLGKYGEDFRLLLNQKFKVGQGPPIVVFRPSDIALANGDRMAGLLGQFVPEFLRSFDQSSAPPEFRSRLERTAELMVFFGLRINCICFDGPYRFLHDDIMNLEKLYDDWDFKSLAASSELRSYDKYNRGIPMLIFNAVFDSEVEPIQKQLGLGWWRRRKNREKFLNLFGAGVLLGVLYDIKSGQLATEAEQKTFMKKEVQIDS